MMPVDAGLPILSTDNLNVVQHEIAITSPNGTSRRASITSHRRNSSSRRSQTPKARPFATSVPGQQITAKRPVFAASDADGLVHAGTARANIAASVEHPDGTTEDDFARRYEHLTVLQQHCIYWDQDGDGIIHPRDTYNGCRAWGWNLFLCLITAAFIHGGLSYATCPSWFPDPLMRIWISRVTHARHGSDSQTYDGEGRFRPQQFEDIFTKYDREGRGGLTRTNVVQMLRGQRAFADFFGMLAAALEWTAVYFLLWPEDGLMRKEDIRGVYDGSIFFKLAKKHSEKLAREQTLQNFGTVKADQLTNDLYAKVKKV